MRQATLGESNAGREFSQTDIFIGGPHEFANDCPNACIHRIVGAQRRSQPVHNSIGGGTPIPRPIRINYWTDVLALSAGVVVFATGLILFTRFHVAEGSVRLYGWGLSRLAWINIHRLAAVLLLGAVAFTCSDTGAQLS